MLPFTKYQDCVTILPSVIKVDEKSFIRQYLQLDASLITFVRKQPITNPENHVRPFSKLCVSVGCLSLSANNTLLQSE